MPVTVSATEITETTETALYKNGSSIEEVQDFFNIASSGTTLQELNNGDVNKIVQIPKNIVVPDIKDDDTLSVRSKASESSSIVAKMKPNTFATVVDDESYGDWIKVEVDGIDGFVYKDYVLTGKKAVNYINKHTEDYKTGVALLQGTFAVGVYENPDDSIGDKFKYKISAVTNDDVKMYNERTTGEVMKSRTDIVEMAVIHCDKEGTFLYQDKDEESTKVGMVFNEDEATIVEKAEDWLEVANSAGITGYIPSSYIEVKEVEVPINNEVTELKEGTEVKILEEGETWVKVRYEDKSDEENPQEYEGYMQRKGLTITYTPSKKSKAVDTLAYGETFEIIEDEENTNPDFVKTAKGYVRKTYLTDSVIEDEEKIEEFAQNNNKKQKKVDYDLGGIPKGKARDIIEFALKFVGNPYVWGGTSLTKGADCSGFVQSVYKHFGYSLPRVAADQSNAYRSVKLKDVKPGDLLFYEDSNGNIGHVTMYIGKNKVVHASNSRVGIIVSDYNYRNPVCAIRILDDKDLKDVKADSNPSEVKKPDSKDNKDLDQDLEIEVQIEEELTTENIQLNTDKKTEVEEKTTEVKQ